MIRKKVKHIYFKSFIDNADIINTHNYFTSYSEFFIFKKVLPYLYDDEIIDIFRFEVTKLIEVTNQYKQLHIFDVRIRENKANVS